LGQSPCGGHGSPAYGRRRARLDLQRRGIFGERREDGGGDPLGFERLDARGGVTGFDDARIAHHEHTGGPEFTAETAEPCHRPGPHDESGQGLKAKREWIR